MTGIFTGWQVVGILALAAGLLIGYAIFGPHNHPQERNARLLAYTEDLERRLPYAAVATARRHHLKPGDLNETQR